MKQCKQTWSKNPDIIADSYEDFDPNAPDDIYSTLVVKVKPETRFLQDQYTVGVAFTLLAARRSARKS